MVWGVIQVLFREDVVGGRESKEKIEIEEEGIHTLTGLDRACVTTLRVMRIGTYND